ncbi:MAG TPA: DUF4142 domain-containing protein [Bacteroidales bacterium]|nr:DUF4142 domain-containing protein [Bacteroidales bacterium]
MKTHRLFLLLIPLFMLACNSKPKADKNLNDDALLVENAKVKAESDNETRSVEKFVEEAAIGGMMEVELGSYAQKNAVNQRVKNFGAMMVRDHNSANEELKSIASAKKLQVPASMDDDHIKKAAELKQKTGADFDSEYMSDMVDDHEKDVDEFKKQSENGKDPEIRAFAAKTLPVLQVHLDSARNIRDALKRK